MEAIVGYPFRKFIETILARLIGKFINPEHPIDLKQVKFNRNVIQLCDLDLNVHVLNQIDDIKSSPLVIVKCVIGQFKLNIQDIFKKKVSLAISDVEIVMAPSQKAKVSTKAPTKSGQPSIRSNRLSDESSMVNDWFAQIFRNAEISLQNIVFKVGLKSFNQALQMVPTLMLRVKNMSFERKLDLEKESNVQKSELENLLHGKDLVLDEASVHLMHDQFLITTEYVSQGLVNPTLQKLKFPYEYPLLNHPSTLIVVKGKQSPGFVCQFRFKHEQISADHDSSQASWLEEIRPVTHRRVKMGIDIKLPLIEACLDFSQLKQLLEFAACLNKFHHAQNQQLSTKKPSSGNNPFAKAKPTPVDEEISLLMNLTQEFEALKSSCIEDEDLKKSLTSELASMELSQEEMVNKVLKREEKTENRFNNPYEQPISKEKEEVLELNLTGQIDQISFTLLQASESGEEETNKIDRVFQCLQHYAGIKDESPLIAGPYARYQLLVEKVKTAVKLILPPDSLLKQEKPSIRVSTEVQKLKLQRYDATQMHNQANLIQMEQEQLEESMKGSSCSSSFASCLETTFHDRAHGISGSQDMTSFAMKSALDMTDLSEASCEKNPNQKSSLNISASPVNSYIPLTGIFYAETDTWDYKGNRKYNKWHVCKNPEEIIQVLDSPTALTIQYVENTVESRPKPSFNFQVGKLFTFVSMNEVLTIMNLIRIIPDFFMKKSPKKEQNLPIDMNVTVDGLELEINFLPVCQENLIHLQGTLNSPNICPVQDQLSLLGCRCLRQKNIIQAPMGLVPLSTLKLNVGRILNTNKIVRFISGELLALINNKDISLIGIEDMAFSFEEAKFKTMNRSQSFNKIQNWNLQESNIVNFGEETNFSQSIFQSQQKEEKPDELFVIPESDIRLYLQMQEMTIDLNSADFSDLALFISSQEVQLKSLSNIMDIQQVLIHEGKQKKKTNFGDILSQSFHQQDRTGPTIWLRFILNNFNFALLESEKQSSLKIRPSRTENALIRLRAHKFALDLQMVDEFTAITTKKNFKVDLQIQQFFLLDLINQEAPVYIPGKYRFNSDKADQKLNQSKQSKLDFELDMNSQRNQLIVHPSEIKGRDPMLSVHAQIQFDVKGTYQERTSSEEIAEILDQPGLKTHQRTMALYQMGRDLKKNPMNIYLQVNVGGFVIKATNQIVSMGDKLAYMFAVDFVEHILDARKDLELKDHFQPKNMPIINVEDQTQVFLVSVSQGIYLQYTPTLKKSRLESLLQIPPHERFTSLTDDYLFRSSSSCIISLEQLSIRKDETYSLKVNQLSFEFLNDTTEILNKETRILYERKRHQEQSELKKQGYVTVLAVNDLSVSNEIEVDCGGVLLNLTRDSLYHLLGFGQIIKASIQDSQSQMESNEQRNEKEPQKEQRVIKESQIVKEVEKVIHDNPELLFSTNLVGFQSSQQEKLPEPGWLAQLVDETYLNENSNGYLVEKNRKIIHERSNKIQYINEFGIRLHNVTVNIFDGNDFDFVKENNFSPVDLQPSKFICDEDPIFNTELEPSIMIEKDYMKESISIPLKKDQVSGLIRKTTRISSRFVRLSIEDLHFTRRLYHKEKLVQKMAFSIRDLQLTETIHSPGKRRELMIVPYTYRHQNFCQVEVQLEEPIQQLGDERQELVKLLSLKATLRPIKLELNQSVIDFTIKFLSVVQQDHQEQNEKLQKKGDKILIKNIQIPCSFVILCFSYGSMISVQDLMINLNEFNLTEQQKLQGTMYVAGTDPDIAVQMLADFYKQDLISNQKIQMLSGIKPLRRVFGGIGSVFGLITKPLAGGYNKGTSGVIVGFGEGVSDLLGFVGGETYDLYYYMLKKGKNWSYQ